MVDALGLADVLSGNYHLLISWHGAAFPLAAWGPLVGFLKRGGHLACFGGVIGEQMMDELGHAAPEQIAYTAELHLGQVVPIMRSTGPLTFVADDVAPFLTDVSIGTCAGDEFWACTPQLSEVADHPEDLGGSARSYARSAGARG
ncbi:MAG: hypothetical protein H0X24_10105 [Ktedonobacterales bacterium]|nr:hypothetical protein [Ktedonobacterales bacterium]